MILESFYFDLNNDANLIRHKVSLIFAQKKSIDLWKAILFPDRREEILVIRTSKKVFYLDIINNLLTKPLKKARKEL